MGTQPAKGDVIVRQSPGRKAAPRYALRTSSCTDQLLFAACDVAVAHALAFARFAGVAAWIDDPDGGPVLLGSHRSGCFPAGATGDQTAVAIKHLGHGPARVAPNLQS